MPFRWLWRWGRRRASPAGAPAREDPLVAAGRALRQRREERQLSLRQLALDTRISTPVLEALERGWRDRLPEAAYLRTMLPLIERHLELQPGSLEGVLPTSADRLPPQEQPRGLLQRFTPGSIDVFTTWQGTLLYGVLTLGLVYGLNLQQRQLAQEGLLAVSPIPPLPMQEQGGKQGSDQALLAIVPSLRPLQQAGAGQALALWRRQSPAAAPPQQAISPRGALVVTLAAPASLNLETAGGGSTELKAASGRLEFSLSAPWTLRITPAPTSPGAVQWLGQSLRASPGEPGRFQPQAR